MNFDLMRFIISYILIKRERTSHNFVLSQGKSFRYSEVYLDFFIGKVANVNPAVRSGSISYLSELQISSS